VLGWPVSFLPVIHAIREGANVALPNAGIVQFPSYHTVMAIVFTYVCRDVKLLLAPAAALNTLVVVSVPFSGNHYATDIVGGAIVAAVSLWAAGLLCKRFAG
jgi:membrane-associated phospholipid phosphatase